ncbi:AGC family protein kinase [Trichomonas vaginalis G3]|uniref:non-specific serine/threonine protein kinase n=1 Tax=Trichomonas vaginalis (strain ATCC PRA-98 / G3) TaxID=412133 RepID=A2EIC5_TRIV3|nr:STKc Nek domain-containing protein [Trichomonas vaginalis G3]EAY07607.1 AGC family protein kinase [Trichomonas vaginalis G3]KAI5502507.1 STKc Nek domain-containing protein [Trichomonas vaginalis G3]|eukprot:XP_001319830.1 AGC family protein kinase [Trichomonas vaginalis G3]
MDKYRVDKVLGKGGFGKALLVTSLENESKKRVVKQIILSKLSEKQQLKAESEITILSTLKHTNIVRYRGCKKTKSSLFILMDYADGGDLQQLLKRRNLSSIPEDKIIDWFTQICLAVKYIHDRKIIHRDIKPSNIFLDSNGVLKLGDFGLARFLDSTEAFAATFAGSPYYMPPEICNVQKYNASADIWSLGCVLYEMCNLRKAFYGINVHNIMLDITRNTPSKIRSFYSKELSDLVSSMLNKDPQLRPTINEILQIPIIKFKAIALMGSEVASKELNHTVFHGIGPGLTPSNAPKEIKIDYIPEAEEDDEGVKFMGRKFKFDKECNDTSMKSMAIRKFLSDMLGEEKFSQMYQMISTSSLKIEWKWATKMEEYASQLIIQLIALESIL